MVLLQVWLGCVQKPPQDGGTTSATSPNVLGLSIELTTLDDVSLSRRLHAVSDVPVTLSVTWSSGDHSVTVPFTELSADQSHLLLGWRGGLTYDVVVTATSADGLSATVAAAVQTDPIPAYFPQGQVIPGAGARAAGHTLLPMHTYANVEVEDIIVVFDEEGQIVYWLPTEEFILDVKEWNGGWLALVGSSTGRVVHYAWDGTVLGSWVSRESEDEIDASSMSLGTKYAEHFHHDVTPFPQAPNLLVGLGRYPVPEANYPASYYDPGPTSYRQVAYDVLVTYDTETGLLLDELPLSEVLPKYRIGYDSIETTVEGWADWTHLNAVVVDGDDFVVSLRHQDVIAKIDPTARALKWLLGNHDNWPPEYEDLLLTPVGELNWPYHTHAPRVAPDGPNGETVVTVFDNGNYQASPWTGQPTAELPFSRVVQFSVDETAMTVKQDWEFTRPSGGRLYAPAVGDADPLPNGNVLSAWGLLFGLPDGTNNGEVGLADRSVRVIELDPSDPANVTEVEQLYLTVPRDINESGWTGYRADRIPSMEGRAVE